MFAKTVPSSVLGFFMFLVSRTSISAQITNGTTQLSSESTTEQYMDYKGGTIFPDFENMKLREVGNITKEIPTFFDARQKWSYCRSIQRIYHQGRCGSCWAVASVSVMSDRLCIQTKGDNQFEFSAEDLLTCCPYCSEPDKCAGGRPDMAFKYWVQYGIVSGGGVDTERGCKPYGRSTFRGVPKKRCIKRCIRRTKAYKRDKRYGTQYYVMTNNDQDLRQLQYEIMENGPVLGAMWDIYEDFREYKKGIYIHTEGDQEADGHAIKLIGWGVENDVDYWLVANTWGTKWGNKGFFKILKGVNHCKIEKLVIAGDAEIGCGRKRTISFLVTFFCVGLRLVSIVSW